jgi:hypothetical protein
MNQLPELPKFLICDTHTEAERCFVLHTGFPRFLAECLVGLSDNDFAVIRRLWLEKVGDPLIYKRVMVDAKPEFLCIVDAYESMDENTMQPQQISQKFEATGQALLETLDKMAIWYYNEIASY